MTDGLHSTFQLPSTTRMPKLPRYCQLSPPLPRSTEALNQALADEPCWVIRAIWRTRSPASSWR